MRDRRLRGHCQWCGGEIFVGEPAYGRYGVLLHRDCLEPQLAEDPGLEFLAAFCGWEEVIA